MNTGSNTAAAARPTTFGSLDGVGAGDHGAPYRFGRTPNASAPFPCTARQYARLLVLRGRVRDHRWYEVPRADALRGHHADFARRSCPSCRSSVLSLFKPPRRYGDDKAVCAACYLERIGRSAIVPWRDADIK